ncbi:hypothetical protein C8P66_11820 [Humitalea rosea]|uniref:Aminoglycoside phosphotransferase domain-containing protein n=1 Tax=Humitalea rosea TaxID=990373 RepID=A0A2W7I6F0_9PROT|nr:AAA family ATPase [Humitalea rosea]PZW42234.1 hypothetical protein C8P66_11820 [Humitalea rosea]
MTIPAAQSEAAALLARLTGARPIETHISAVYVGPDRVLKMKKAVALDFLDFSGLADRRRFLRREFELNAPFAPGLYRGVLPIGRRDGALVLGAEPAEEWVLEMAPVPPGDFLDAVAARGELDETRLDALADAVLAMHAALPEVPGVDQIERLLGVVASNRRAALGAGLPPVRIEALAASLTSRLQGLRPCLAARQGHIRRCHGDLHLGNLLLWHGRPTPFDALEFDEALAEIDTGYDLAFLLMDLDRRCGRAAANRVLNRYVGRGGDAGLLGPLPVWLAIRALIRAQCEATAGHDGLPLLAVAEAFLHAAPAPVLAIGGLQGTGKSRLARALAPDLGPAPGAVILRSDEIRKRLHGVAPEASLPDSAYTPAASAAVHAEMLALLAAAIAAGHAVILDAMFLDPLIRAEVGAAASPARFRGIWLEAPLDVLRARVAGRHGDASDATVAVLERSAAADPGTIEWARLDASGDALPAARDLLDQDILRATHGR